MNYVLVWPRETLDELAAAWLESADRKAITEASFAIERALSSHPFNYGIGRKLPCFAWRTSRLWASSSRS